ncbi:MAG: HAD-IA family hydrolase [archaeon]
MVKVILVDAWKTFVTDEGLFLDMKEMLDEFPNKKIILTNANEEELVRLGIVNMPYEVFTLAHNPNKSDPEYYKKLLEKYALNAEDTIYFEHSQEAVKSAQAFGIKTLFYDENKRDLDEVREFLRKNLQQKALKLESIS